MNFLNWVIKCCPIVLKNQHLRLLNRTLFATGKNKHTNATPDLHFALQTLDMHSQLSQIATLTSNLGRQNRGINRVAKTPSLNPPKKMHAFKVFLVCYNTDFIFSERDNAEITTCSILVHPRSFTIQQYNQKCSLNYVLQLFQGTFYREAQYKKPQMYNGIKTPHQHWRQLPSCAFCMKHLRSVLRMKIKKFSFLHENMQWNSYHNQFFLYMLVVIKYILLQTILNLHLDGTYIFVQS